MGMLREGIELPWRLNLIFNGHYIRDAKYEALVTPPLPCPCLLVCSRNDHYRDYDDCRMLATYSSPVVIEHDGWHDLPMQPPQAAEVYAEVAAVMRWHCGFQTT